MKGRIEMDKIYYLDSTATQPMLKEVKEEVVKFLDQEYFNPSAVYAPSVDVKRKIENARKIILDALGSVDGSLVFTSSATEANNMVIFSQKNKNKKCLFGMGEHSSVRECALELQKRGFVVEFIPLDQTGHIDLLAFKQMMSEDVGFVSIQHVSNETGAINDIQKLVKIARRVNPNVVVHADGVQAFMRFEYSVADLDVDFYTISGHKIGASKGVGALYVKKGAKIQPLIFGGGQEKGLRSGTENVFTIISFGLATEINRRDLKKNCQNVAAKKEKLLSEFKKQGLNYKLNSFEPCVPHIMSICLKEGIRGETLVHALEPNGVYISTGSACSATRNMNRTLEAMGVSQDIILSSVRISLSPYIDIDEDKVAEICKREIDKLIGKK